MFVVSYRTYIKFIEVEIRDRYSIIYAKKYSRKLSIVTIYENLRVRA